MLAERQSNGLATASNRPVDASASALLASDCVPEKKSDTVAVYLRISPKLKETWVEACASINVDQSTVGERMIEWFVSQPKEVQLMLIGSLPPRDDLMELVLKRLKANRPVAGEEIGGPEKKRQSRTGSSAHRG